MDSLFSETPCTQGTSQTVTLCLTPPIPRHTKCDLNALLKHKPETSWKFHFHGKKNVHQLEHYTIYLYITPLHSTSLTQYVFTLHKIHGLIQFTYLIYSRGYAKFEATVSGFTTTMNFWRLSVNKKPFFIHICFIGR